VADSSVVPFEPGTTLQVTSRSGSIAITGEDRRDLEVDGAAVHTENTRVRVEGGSGAVKVRAPRGVDVIAGTDSGSVALRGSLGEARVTNLSGSIDVDRVTRLDARTESGTITVQACSGECRGTSRSGSLRVAEAGAVDLATESGSVDAASVGGASIRVGSGSVTVGLTEPGDVSVETQSGSVTVTVPRGARPTARLEAGGSVRCDCETGTDFDLSVRAGSGSITVTEQ
jgi:DUF4097 and DUF4098 domain-containing protein YvlB